MRTVLVAVSVALAACTRQSAPPNPTQPSATPPAASSVAPSAGGVESSGAHGPGGDPSGSTQPTPHGGPRCEADASQCCKSDGTRVVPGGCQPHYPPGVEPATRRDADGWCQPVECHLKCLPRTARIATPEGDRPIDALRAGDAVWTMDAHGARIVGRVSELIARPVTAPHEVVVLRLADGRRVAASAGHPDARGTTLGALTPGDLLDGAAVTAVEHSAYDDTATWDLLPDGPTGFYWADGVLLGSTLRAAPSSEASAP